MLVLSSSLVLVVVFGGDGGGGVGTVVSCISDVVAVTAAAATAAAAWAVAAPVTAAVDIFGWSFLPMNDFSSGDFNAASSTTVTCLCVAAAGVDNALNSWASFVSDSVCNRFLSRIPCDLSGR